MFSFLMMQYKLGRLTEAKLHQYVDKSKITEEQYESILASKQ